MRKMSRRDGKWRKSKERQSRGNHKEARLSAERRHPARSEAARLIGCCYALLKALVFDELIAEGKEKADQPVSLFNR